MGLPKPISGCLVCLNSTEEIVFVPAEESQKIFNICCSYVKNAINVNYLIENITVNQKQLSFCKKCLDSSSILSQRVGQLAKLKKEIIDLTTKFSESVSSRRLQTLTVEDNISHIESSNHLIVDQHIDRIDELDIEEEIVKSEKQDVFTENEDLFTNLFCEDEQINIIVPHPLNNENQNLSDPLESNQFEINCGFARNEEEPATASESLQQIVTTESCHEESAVIKMPHIILERLPGHMGLPTRGGSKPLRRYQPGRDLSRNGSGYSSIKRKTANSTVEPAKKDQLTKPKHTRAKKVQSTTCSYCFKKCSTPTTLKIHVRTHTMEKPFECATCKKRFPNASNLKRHYMCHTGEKPFKCVLCERSFIQSSDLKIHERIHTGVRPYKCSFCEITFISSNRRAKHQRLNHSTQLI